MNSSTENTLEQRLESVQQRIDAALSQAGRSRQSLQLLAVSKNHPVAAMRRAYSCGLRLFGESYVQEAVEKMDAMIDMDDISWHFIGPIQSNKTQAIAARFQWAHSVDRLKIARRLSEQRGGLEPLNICVQVNISGEASKSGVALGELEPLCREISTLPNLRLRGLMAIPRRSTDEQEQRRIFRQVYLLQQHLNEGLAMTLDTLSMGMSADLEAAILEGATIVRVGTDIFGPRAPAGA